MCNCVHEVLFLEKDGKTSEFSYIVKACKKTSREIAVLRYLQKATASSPYNGPSHIIPAEIVDCSQTSLIVMPRLWESLRYWNELSKEILFSFFTQIIEVCSSQTHEIVRFTRVAGIGIYALSQCRIHGMFGIACHPIFIQIH